MTYAATRSSALERAKRNENGERNKLERLCIGAIVSLRSEAEIDGGPLRRESRSRRRRRWGRRDGRRLDRAQAGRRVGRRAGGEFATPFERRAAARRLPVRGLRAGRLSNGRERNARRRSERVRKRRPSGTSSAVHARRDAQAPRTLVLRAPLDLARKLRFRATWERRFAGNVRGPSPRTPVVLGNCRRPRAAAASPSPHA